MTALGLIETKGLLAAIEGADAMLKAANVRLLEKYLAGGGLVTVTVAGEVSAVQASVSAGVSAINRIEGAVLVSDHVIPRPYDEVAELMAMSSSSVNTHAVEAEPLADKNSPQAELESVSVTSVSEISDETLSASNNAEVPSEGSSVSEAKDSARKVADTEATAEKATEKKVQAAPEVTPEAERTVPEISQLKKMTVSKLRQLARSLDNIAMTKKEIKSANKKNLIEAIINAYRQIEE